MGLVCVLGFYCGGFHLGIAYLIGGLLHDLVSSLAGCLVQEESEVSGFGFGRYPDFKTIGFGAYVQHLG